jgi:hypothetical protein
VGRARACGLFAAAGGERDWAEGAEATGAGPSGAGPSGAGPSGAGPAGAGPAGAGPAGAHAAHALVPRGLPEWAPPHELRPTLFLLQPAALFQIAESARAEDARAAYARAEDACSADARSADGGLEGRARALRRALPAPPRRLF